MGETQEQIDADLALSNAIEQCLKAYVGENANEYTVTDFVTLAAIQKITDEGVVVTRYPMYVQGGDMPWYKIHGLIEVHRLQIKASTLDQENNG